MFEFFSSGSGSINFSKLIYQIFNFRLDRFLFIYALLKLFMDHVISESSQRWCKMCVAFKIKSIMPVKCIKVTFISCKLLNLYGSQEEELFCFIFHSFSKELIDLSFEFLDAFSFESETIIWSHIIQMLNVAWRWFGMIN